MFITLGIEIAGIEHRPFDLALYGFGWLLGWLLLWSPRQLPASTAQVRRPVAIVIPARDEAASISALLAPLVAQRRDGDEIVVVDDHSSDGTGAIAASFDVSVTTPPLPHDGWLGKPNACWHGAQSTSAPTLVFLDADVRPGPTLLDDLGARADANPNQLVSVQPWHAMPTLGERPSLLCNVTALMGCGAFSALGSRATAPVAFGPVIAIDRQRYDEVGGHAAPGVRSMHTEDIGLARAVGKSDLFVGGSSATTFRMYPDGLLALVRGWTRSIASGARFTRWWLSLATLLWIWSLAGGWITTPIVYPLSAIQLWVLGRRAGTTGVVGAALYPLHVVVFVAIFLRSLAAIALRREVVWKGRQVSARSG